MRFLRLQHLMVMAAAAAAMPASAARADFNDLVRRLPMESNVVVLIDVEKILKSPMAQKNGWKDKMADDFAEKPMIVPPDATRIALGAVLSPFTMQPILEVSVMEMGKEVSIETIAAVERGFVDSLAGKPAAYSPINAYFVQLKPRLLAAVAPANRQFAARWTKQSETMGSAFLSDYLKNAAVGAGGEYVFAIDLQDAVSMRRCKNRIKSGEFESMEAHKDKADSIAQALASIRGLTLAVSFGAEATARGVIDFNDDATPLSGCAKSLLLEMLSKSGANLDDLKSWTFKTAGKSITAEGRLTPEGLQRLFSIVEPPTPLNGDTTSAGGNTAGGSQDGSAAMAAASKKYYASVSKVIDALEKNASSATSMTQLGTWLRRDSRRIGRLPILNVDPDLLAWSSDTSAKLNDIAATATVGGLSAQARTAGITTPDTDMTYEGNTGSDIYSTRGRQADRRAADQQRVQAGKEEAAKAAGEVSGIIKDLQASRAQIRAQMTSKYNTEF